MIHQKEWEHVNHADKAKAYRVKYVKAHPEAEEKKRQYNAAYMRRKRQDPEFQK
jgi:hypothetical protein